MEVITVIRNRSQFCHFDEAEGRGEIPLDPEAGIRKPESVCKGISRRGSAAPRNDTVGYLLLGHIRRQVL